MLYETEKDFEQNEHFQNDEKSRISVSLDIVELSEDQFKEINSAKRVGQFFVSNRPIDSYEE